MAGRIPKNNGQVVVRSAIGLGAKKENRINSRQNDWKKMLTSQRSISFSLFHPMILACSILKSYSARFTFSGLQSSSGFTAVCPQFWHCHLSLLTLLWQDLGGFDPSVPHQSAFLPKP
jgi:hypothetical protein